MREGKIVWSGPVIIVMIALSREKLMQHVLLCLHADLWSNTRLIDIHHSVVR